jgi:sugar lactone lactonase YvrE
MTTKLKNLYFNRRVPRPDSFVSCYEFQIPGPDTTLRTWCLWRDTIARNETLSVRTNVAYLVTRDTIGAADSIPVYPLTDGSGKIVIYQPNMDIVPRYLHEYGAVSRPDVIVDSVWLVPTNPKAGDSLWFYARLKNIGNDSVKFNIVNKVTFQVDGATKATYQATRGLAPAGDINHKDTLTVGNSNPQAPPPKDWQANYGDHLIRAWADSADRFVELNESNNMAYIQRHMAPSGKLIIPATGYNPGYVGGRKFSNVRPVKLSTEGNGSTIPFPDSVRIKNSWEGTWRPWRGYADSYWDTLNTGDEMKWVSAQWKMASGETSATVVDSIVLDETVPNAWISSPAHGATVSGTASIYGQAHDFGAHFRIDTLRYFRDATHHDTIHVSLTPIGEMVPSLLGSWNTRLVPNGWTRDTLVVWDSAGNFKKDSISLRVRNNQTNGGDSWASNFGTLPSAPMNVATDPAGNVYFAETQNSKIRKYSPRKDSLFAFSARRSDSTGLNWAVGMVLKDSTTLYIADGYGHAIKAFDRQGNLLLRFGSFGTNAGQFRQPCGIALDTKGRLWVSDRLNNRIQVFDSTGSFLFQFGSQGQDSGKFNSPTGITITPNGLVWVSDTRNNQIQVFDSLGQYLKTIKAVDSLGLDTPLGICSDRYGDIFIADAHHNRIVELNPFGERIFDFGGLGDSLCQFRTPVGVASSPGAHYLYVADMGNRRVQKFIVIEEDTTGGGPQGGAGVHLPPVNFLGPARPNPTRGEATIEYGLAKESPVTLSIYNVTGQVVKEINQGKQKAGYYSLTWDGRSNLGHKVGAGVYFYRLQAGNWAKTRKMVVIR